MAVKIVIVKDCELRTYEYHIEGATVVKVLNHQNGGIYEMPFRKNRPRAILTDKKGRYIKLNKYKHYLEDGEG